MAYGTGKRVGDGLLGWVDESPEPLNEAAIIQSAVNVLGGVAGDYIFQGLTQEQAQIIRDAMPARSKLVNGVLTSATPITVTLNAGTVEADGVAEIILSVDVHQNDYAGAVKVRVLAPDGSLTTQTLTAVAGVATDEHVSTELVGVHQVTAETALHGFGFADFEGV